MNLSAEKTRRHFLGVSLSTFLCGLSLPSYAAFKSRSPEGVRALSFHNLHTDEKLSVTYWKNGSYDRTAWAQINHVLRDHYSGESHVMDLRLMDLLHEVQNRLENDRTIEIISGYRSPATNRNLAEASGGVAKNSYHMRGMAIDVRMDGTTLSRLHQTALQLNKGGVGYYPDSQFVHLDVGPIRRWG
jgi:uncharacterized protein YcbK (DUF882 family)